MVQPLTVIEVYQLSKRAWTIRIIVTNISPGLKINVTKSKLLALNTATACSITVDGDIVEEVDGFCYLVGSYIQKYGSASTENRRDGMLNWNNIWKSSQISRNLKLKIFRTSYLAALLYGCETY